MPDMSNASIFDLTGKNAIVTGTSAGIGNRLARTLILAGARVAAIARRTTELDDGLREEDAYPAMPEDGYGWEKLFSERMCRHFREDFGMHTRMARYHNI